jgi:long-chain acyl-CoA synthetase
MAPDPGAAHDPRHDFATEEARMNESLACSLIAAAERHPERIAVRLGERSMSYAELKAATHECAELLLGLGVHAGDRVALMLPNVPEFAVAYYGALRAGAVIVPINVLLKAREVKYLLRDSGAAALLCWHECLAEADQPAEELGVVRVVVAPDTFEERLVGATQTASVADRAGDDTAVIMYTSGTTGRPKGAQLTHANLTMNAAVTCDLLGADEHDVLLGVLPMFHAFGQNCVLNVAIRVGATVSLVTRFEPGEVLETLARDRVTIFEGVPTMYSALLHHPRDKGDVTSLRVCASGGAALPVEVLHGFEQAFGCVVLEGYGLSETTAVASFNHRDRVRLPGSIGTPIAGVEMKVVDGERATLGTDEVGEIAIRGHNVMKGYLNQPEATAEAVDPDGWFYTGDIGRVDADGRYYIVDRKKDMIIRGGYNVYPREIEEVIYEHPAVREAAVVGIPHPYLGEEVGAAVALNPGAELTEFELRAFIKANVAAYKYPRHVWFLAELPKGPTGKILKREISRPAALVHAG